MSEPTRKTRTRLGRRLSWLVVGAMLATALLAPGATVNAAPLSGAIWTSTSDGTIVNQNQYANKSDVYLNGGPQNCGSGSGLPDGLYYFQVTDPSGKTLLSSDAIKFRMVEVTNGVIAGVGGTGNHVEGTSGCDGGTPVQLMPFDDTPNPGGEYSVDLAPAGEVEACEGFDADSTFNFRDCNPSSKNDNFKVGATDPTDAPPTDTPPTDTPPTDTPPTDTPPTDTPPTDTPPTDTPPTDTPPTDTPPTDTPPTATPTGEVNPATGTPAGSVAPTLPPTDLSGGTGDGPTGDAWRLVLLALAGVLAAALLLTPASAVVRRKD